MAFTWKLNSLDPVTNMAFLYHPTNEIQEEHDHEFMEVEYVYSGKVVQTINGKEFLCDEGDFLFFYVGDKHSYKPIGEVKIINLIFNPHLFEEMKFDKFFPITKRINSFVDLPKDEERALAEVLQIMQHEFHAKKEGYVYVLKSLLQYLVSILLRYGYQQKTLDKRVERIIKLIDEKPYITITEIADEVGFCNSHVSRLFKDSTGVPLKTYMNKHRILYAYDLIKTTDLSIESIMEKIDLSNRTHFYNLFKFYVGTTPGELRKR